MSFSRLKYQSLIFSGLVIILMFLGTYSIHGGFKRSIQFNGGIRLSIMMPGNKDKADLEKAVHQAGYKESLVRQTDPRLNAYDLEMGPDLRDEIDLQLRQKRKEQQKQIDALEAANKEVPADLRVHESVSDVIARRVLEQMGLGPEQIISRETIAGSYGDQLGLLALRMMFFTLVAIGLYLTFRFDFPFALGASIALVHDVIMTIGFIGIMQIEPSIPVLAAVLTIVGYSINDTIVIFDRIRENINDRQQATLGATIDLAITQTLSRTIVTSVLTLLAALALFMGGESSLEDFALVLVFGLVIGTYSSIFVASNAVQIYEGLRDRFR
ncbi:MAG: protein translocase subunit SecF [Leptospiraceae bacterium]|nr:protein translocase subunit SecF [Leptospiraceae bacterium]